MRRKRKKIAIILLALLIWSGSSWLASFVATRASNLKVQRLSEPFPDGGTMNYFIAGTWNQPGPAFAFLDENLPGKDFAPLHGEGVTLIPYSRFGVDYDQICKWIASDVVRGEYDRVRIFAISVGCRVSRYMATQPLEDVDIEVYELNPCLSKEFVNEDSRKTLERLIVPVSGVDYLLGWLSFVPVLSGSGQHFSPRLTMDQMRAIAWSSIETNDTSPNVKCVVVESLRDELLDNTAIEDFYAGYEIIRIDATHAGTIGTGDRYFEAVVGALR